MSKPKLWVRSLKEPIELEPNEASGIEAILGDEAKDNDSHIIIEGVWSGKKKDIRFIQWPKSERKSDKESKGGIPTMTDGQAQVFEDKIFPYQMQAEASGLGTYRWTEFYCQGMGAIRLEAKEVNKTIHLVTYVRDPDMYQVFLEEIDSYLQWKAKKEYGELMRAKQLEEMAQQQANLVNHMAMNK